MTPTPDTELMIEAICRDVCELPDRTSPEDAPDLLSVTVDELADILRHRIASTRPADSALAGELAADFELFRRDPDFGAVKLASTMVLHSEAILAALRQPAPRADDALRDAAERLANAADGVAYTSKTAVMDDAIDAVRAALASEEPKRTQAVVPDFKLSDEAKAKIALIEDNMRMAPQRMREMGLAAYSDPPAAQADEDRETMRWVKGTAAKGD